MLSPKCHSEASTNFHRNIARLSEAERGPQIRRRANCTALFPPCYERLRPTAGPARCYSPPPYNGQPCSAPSLQSERLLRISRRSLGDRLQLCCTSESAVPIVTRQSGQAEQLVPKGTVITSTASTPQSSAPRSRADGESAAGHLVTSSSPRSIKLVPAAINRCSLPVYPSVAGFQVLRIQVPPRRLRFSLLLCRPCLCVLFLALRLRLASAPFGAQIISWPGVVRRLGKRRAFSACARATV